LVAIPEALIAKKEIIDDKTGDTIERLGLRLDRQNLDTPSDAFHRLRGRLDR
jgi:hypothetical protein